MSATCKRKKEKVVYSHLQWPVSSTYPPCQQGICLAFTGSRSVGCLFSLPCALVASCSDIRAGERSCGSWRGPRASSSLGNVERRSNATDVGYGVATKGKVGDTGHLRGDFSFLTDLTLLMANKPKTDLIGAGESNHLTVPSISQALLLRSL